MIFKELIGHQAKLGYNLNMDLSNLSVTELCSLLSSGQTNSVEIVEHYLSNITEYNNTFNIYLFIKDKVDILKEAEEADKARSSGSSKKLLGIPFSIKDSYMALGTPTTAGDNYLKNTVSEYNSVVVEKLIDEGAILLGKVNMDAWGFGSSTENSSYGVTRNPYDESRVAGGSSGGSGASVALDMCAFSIGEDTGGSVRNPASFCGTFGMKPTYGRISRFGCIAYASSLDTVGIISRSSQDLDLIFDVLKEHDVNDMTLDTKVLESNNDKKKFAWSTDFIPGGIDGDVKKIYLETIESLKSKGFEAIEVSFPMFDYCIPTYYITAMSEASTNLSRYHGTRYGDFQRRYNEGEIKNIFSWEDVYKRSRSEGFNKETKRRIFLGAYVSSEGYNDAYYKKAQKIRNLIYTEIDEILGGVDFILSPVTPTPAPKIGHVSDNPVQGYLEDIYTVTANLAGIPAIAFPAGKSKDGLPIGMQMMGKRHQDEKLVRILTNFAVK
jgi:aspartyl-tRNA(Asn)/glutamyl-tRNA(Gln) amidotransferase subunit A